MPELEEENEASSYVGRWIARVRGKIVAQGETADQALQSARQTRPKEVPEIVFIPAQVDGLNHPLFSLILDHLPTDQDLYLVGGAVRDFLLQRNTHDLDFVVTGSGTKVARRIANRLGAAFYALDKEYDIGRVVVTNEDLTRDILDFATMRGGTIESDLLSRDFTINSMAYNLKTRKFLDPTDGVADIRKGIIRTCSKDSIAQDPVRVLRAVRFAASLGYSIEKETTALIKQSVGLLRGVSPERIRDEIFKILDGPKPSSVIRSLDMLGGLDYCLPEIPKLRGVKQPIPHNLDVWGHTLKSLDYLEAILDVLAPGYVSEKTNDLLTGLLTMKLGRYREKFREHFSPQSGSERSLRSLLFFSMLYHDIGKPKKIEIADEKIHFHGHEQEGAILASGRAIKLRLSNGEISRIKTAVKNHMRIINHISQYQREGKIPTRKALYRFFRDTGPVGVDLCLMALADQRATYVNEMTQPIWTADLDIVRIFLENWWEKPEETINPTPLINGDELMSVLGLKQGPIVGKLLEVIREAQAVGDISSRDEAIEFSRTWLSVHAKKDMK